MVAHDSQKVIDTIVIEDNDLPEKCEINPVRHLFGKFWLISVSSEKKEREVVGLLSNEAEVGSRWGSYRVLCCGQEFYVFHKKS
jgi:phosphatidate phosphatase PAH1